MNSQSKEIKKKFTSIEREFYMLNEIYASKDNKGKRNYYNII
jgi:hypothetical protein